MESNIIKFGDSAENQVSINTDKKDYLDMLPEKASELIEAILILGEAKKKDAERGLDMLVMQFPNDLNVKSFAALSYFHNGKKQKALNLIEENYYQDKDHVLTRCALARIEILCNNPMAVGRIFNNDFRVIEPNKDRVLYLAEFYELLYTFGLFFGSIGHKENAVNYTKNFKSAAHPNHPYLQELMDMCCKRFGVCLHKNNENAEQPAQEAAPENDAMPIEAQAQHEAAQ